MGVYGPTRVELSVEGLVGALRHAVRLEVLERAQSIAGRLARDGARHAAERLVSEFGVSRWKNAQSDQAGKQPKDRMHNLFIG